MNYKIGENGD